MRSKIKVIGHRGAAGLEPENTLRAFKKALALKLDEIELDVLPSKDGYLMVIHDDKVNRTTDGRGHIENLTLAELKKMDAGKGETIPTLEEVFKLVKNSKIILNIELKKAGYEKAVTDLIKKFNYLNRVYIISFVPEAIKRVKEINPKIKTGLDVEIFFNPEKIAKELKADRILFEYKFAKAKLISKIKELGMESVVWTVNHPKDIKKVIKLGVDGICSNYPDRVLEILKFNKLMRA